MTAGFTYMGTKRQIAGQVAEVISRAPSGALLDAFAGMSAVGAASASERSVWCNDIQFFAYNVAKSYFTAGGRPKLSSHAVSQCHDFFEDNQKILRRTFASPLSRESCAYDSADLNEIRDVSDYLTKRCESGSAAKKRTSYRFGQMHAPYCLFATTYAGGYVGLEQAIEIDSLRFAIDELARQKMVNTDTRRWMLIALCRALGRISNSTGHFAQYMAVKEHTKQRFLAKRGRSVWREWQSALDVMYPFGTKEWRQSNRVFQSEAVQLIRRLSRYRNQPAVIYCDPPYTGDHYSRYYHLVETLLLYDYPEIYFKGQYRSNRFYSPFSIRTQVHQAFKDLIDAAARLKATLVLSYPENGLFMDPRQVLVQLLRERFSRVEVAAELIHEHSTLGASNGVESSPVIELVFWAQN